ncbi:MAG TPA: CinA family protein, partial [Synergistales bacterium]|nr:CinA family protein [Synergistales bacterium]
KITRNQGMEITSGAALVSEACIRGWKICVAESCTGGLAGALLTESEGSSRAFVGGAVCYSNEAKIRVLGVDPGIIERFGAVSGECALAMARGAKKLFGADVAGAITGVAGPGGGSKIKPVGLVWFCVTFPGGEKVFHRILGGQRADVRRCAADLLVETMLDMVGGDPSEG